MHAEFFPEREQMKQPVFGISKNPNRSVHFHSPIEVCMILEGEVEVLINDRRQILKAGEIAAAFSFDAHGYRALGEARSAYLIIPTDFCGEFLPLFTEQRAGNPFVCDSAVFDRVYAAFCEINNGTNELAARGHIYVILGTLLSRLTLEERRDIQTPSSYAKLLLYVNEHYKSELTLSMLAEAFGYNPSYLSRSFRETFGIGFNRYLTMVRLRAAILLLRAGGRSVTDCALESGFGSLRSFYRAFFTEFGCTPRQYLDNIRK